MEYSIVPDGVVRVVDQFLEVRALPIEEVHLPAVLVLELMAHLHGTFLDELEPGGPIVKDGGCVRGVLRCGTAPIMSGPEAADRVGHVLVGS